VDEQNLRLLEQFMRVVNGDGDPSDLGCHGTVGELLVRGHEIFPDVPVCVISDWVWVDISMSEEMTARLRSVGNVEPALLYSESVQFDEKGRFGNGSVVRTSLLAQFKAPCFFRTRNTLYVMQGRGVRLSVEPDVIVNMVF